MSHSSQANPFFAGSTRFAGKKLHLGISGSIACYKAADLLRAWLKQGIDVSVTLTAAAREFVSPLLFEALGACKVYDDMFAECEALGHLEPGRLAEALVVAPASADILAKFAHGLAPDMLSAQFLAFTGQVVIAPAMNPRMWQHYATIANIRTLRDAGCAIIGPGTGSTACGEEGQGRLADIPEIVMAGLRALVPQDMTGKKVMITLGPTRETWDGVRFWSNPSSGLMGCALATAAWLRGARVAAVAGPVAGLFLPQDIERINVQTAREMLEAADGIWPDMDMGIFCAAVADFAPQTSEEYKNSKISKKDHRDGLTMRLEPNPDILLTLAKKRTNNQRILGFAAEITPDAQSLLPAALEKLVRKGADIIAANRVNPGTGAFGAQMAEMAVVDAHGTREVWQPQSKADIAWNLLTWLLNY